MEIIEKMIDTKDYLSKSKLPASDYVINPYVGCPHACKYCYASFMKRFTGHEEEWGSFIDIKKCEKPINVKRIEGKSIFISSVTDCYNVFEKKHKVTRKILEQIADSDCEVTISTKSVLVLRDIDLLRKFKNLKVAISLNTLDEKFQENMDKASKIQERLRALKILHDEGIYTVLFMSPIFPYITECEGLIEVSKDRVCEYWFENLNLRGTYKNVILNYIRQNYPQLLEKYKQIYLYKDFTYWEKLSYALDTYCSERGLRYINYFYHDELVKEKLRKGN